MTDPANTSSWPTPISKPQPPTGYLVRHNELIVGIFDNEGDANDAKQGYEMQNEIQLGDQLEILQLV